MELNRAPKIKNVYNASNSLCKKISYENNSNNFIDKITFYSRDASGNVLRIIEKPGNIIAQNAPPANQFYETPIYTMGRIGVRYSVNVFDAANTPTIGLPTYGPDNQYYNYEYTRAAMKQINASTEYELSNHLGNVRVTYRKSITGEPILVKTGYTDYYPLGMAQDGRQQISANKYRFGYQGQFAEKCDETGWNSFELRAYDNRTGRWMAGDPYEQYWSPYISMGNNWVSRVDKDGGTDDDGSSWYEPDFIGPLPKGAIRFEVRLRVFEFLSYKGQKEKYYINDHLEFYADVSLRTKTELMPNNMLVSVVPIGGFYASTIPSQSGSFSGLTDPSNSYLSTKFSLKNSEIDIREYIGSKNNKDGGGVQHRLLVDFTKLIPHKGFQIASHRLGIKLQADVGVNVGRYGIMEPKHIGVRTNYSIDFNTDFFKKYPKIPKFLNLSKFGSTFNFDANIGIRYKF